MAINTCLCRGVFHLCSQVTQNGKKTDYLGVGIYLLNLPGDRGEGPSLCLMALQRGPSEELLWSGEVQSSNPHRPGFESSLSHQHAV